MKNSLLVLLILLGILPLQAQKVAIATENSGQKLTVNGKAFFINGMNWDYYPIGTNYSYSLWKQKDEIIKAALNDEMTLLKNMNVNAIRVYTGIPPKWIAYIYENYGIYTMLNHSFGRYGLNIKGSWTPNTNYANPDTKELLLNEVKEMVITYQNTPGLLLFLLGNENNYGLFWEGAETENTPIKDRKSVQKAVPMYQLFNEAALEMKKISTHHPIALCNGDLLFLDIIAKECPDIDVFGTNMYRGRSFGDAFSKVKNEYGKPLLFTEFGADAYNAKTNEEDQDNQSDYLLENWKEIYENAAGMGKAENAIGGFTFQFSDGWWKNGQTNNLDVHDTQASWSNGGYQHDFENGENNMNEEWFGITAKGATKDDGTYALYPRKAYYTLKEAHLFDPYNNAMANSMQLSQMFSKIKNSSAILPTSTNKKEEVVKISNLRAEFTTFNTGGSLTTTPKEALPSPTDYPTRQGFDHLQSYYIGVEGNPTANMKANVNVNILGHVAENPIDQIFYENRGRTVEVLNQDGTTKLQSINRVQIYNASYNWNHKFFNLNGFYRTGHYHWGYEGDAFGLYPEANYGPNMDIYNGEAPFGFEFTGKKELNGLKIAFGPELWWGANPALLVKYSRKIGKLDVTGIFHEDLDQRGTTQSSFAVPQPKTRRATLVVQKKFNQLAFDLGAIWGGQPLNGRDFQVYRDGEVYQSQINNKDNWGGKTKITYTGGKFNWYAQAAAMGLVANGGADYTQTFTGWRLKDSGSGNQYNILTGFTYSIGNLQIAPNFLWQKPIEGPIPFGVNAPGRPRNILDDPFVVRANREQTAGEILLTYDPTPATWMYNWDSDRTEDAPFAMSAGFVYRKLPTTQDAAIGILPNGRTTFAFPGAAPAKDLWEAHAKIISKMSADFGIIANIYGGTAQANGSDARTVERFGLDLRAIYKKLKWVSMFKLNDYGPYDYHRDYNLTFPMQIIGDLSLEINKPDWWMLPGTRIGIRGTYRTLNKYSPRYNPTQTINAAGNWVPDPMAIGFPNGNEWEIRTYIHINISK